MKPILSTITNLDLVSYLPPKAQYLVELGCADGSLGDQFKELNPKARYVGFEHQTELVAQASTKLDQVWCLPATEIDLDRQGLHQKIDCLIIHTAWLDQTTWPETLQKLLPHVADDAPILFVLENPVYIRKFLTNLQGQATKTSFPLNALLAELTKQKLSFDLILAEQSPTDEALRQSQAFGQFLNALKNFCAAQSLNVNTNIFAKRFLVRASKNQNIQRLLLQTVVGEQLTARVRLGEPNTFLATTPGFDYQESFRTEQVPMDPSNDQKVIILQRLLFRDSPGAKPFFDTIRQHNYLLVYEIDDNPHIWEEAFTLSRNLEFLGSHAVQVSTKPLVEYIKQFNPHVLYFQNHLRALPKPRVYDQDKPVTIFFGALNRKDDWKVILDPLNSVLKNFGPKVHVEVVWDEEFFKAIQTEHKTFLGPGNNLLVPYPDYARILHKSDIALLPLRDTPINRMKSDLKFIEAGGHGAVVLASPTVYAETVRHGSTGFIYRNNKEFVDILCTLITKPERRYEIADNAYNYVRKYRLLSDHYEERLLAYTDLLKQLPALNAEVNTRMQSWPGK